jgi:hypothetical protein
MNFNRCTRAELRRLPGLVDLGLFGRALGSYGEGVPSQLAQLIAGAHEGRRSSQS